MSTFYIKNSQISGDKVIIIGEDVNHIKNVLRCKLGENLDVCDESAEKYSTKIEEISKDTILTKIIGKYDESTEPTINVTLFQGLPKADKMEMIIQKCTELGVTSIVPVITDRIIVKIDEKSELKKLERWNKIALEASKQSGRQRVPKVEKIVNLRNIVENISKYDIVLLPYECEKKISLKDVLRNKSKDFRNIGIIIGPEGGFSQKDIKTLEEEKIKKVTLGPRILRTETAGLATLAMVMYELQN